MSETLSATPLASRPTGPRRGLKWEVGAGKIGAWIAESDFGTAPGVTAVLHEAISDGLLTYLPRRTASEAREAFSSFCERRYGWRFAPEHVHIVPDVLSALRATIEFLSEPGAPVAVPTPAYAPFLTLPGELGREVIQVPSRILDGRWSIDLDGIDAAFRSGARLLILCNPHNPLGTVLSRAEMMAITALVDHHGARVFADEIHAPLVFGGARHLPYASTSATAAEHTVTATAASKGWNVPGLKSAQMILTSAHDHSRWSASTLVPDHLGSVLGALAATAAYSADGELWLDRTVERLQANRDEFLRLVASRLPDVRLVRPDATYLAWMDFSATRIAEAPAAILDQRAGVVASDGAESGAGFAGAIRFNFALAPETLRNAVDRIASVLDAA